MRVVLVAPPTVDLPGLDAVLVARGCSIAHCGSARGVTAMLLGERADLLLCVPNLYDGDLATVCRAVRALPAGARCPILAVATTPTCAAIAALLANGADDYLTLPCTRQQLDRLFTALRLPAGVVVPRTAPLRFDQLRELQAVVDLSPDLICTLGVDGRYIFVSEGYRTLLGYEPQQLIGRLVVTHMDPEDIPPVFAALAAHRRGDTSSGLDGSDGPLRIRHAGGHWLYLEARLRNLTDKGGNVTGFVIVSRDLSVQRRTEAALYEREQQSRLLFEGSPAPTWVFDTDTLRFLQVNAAAVAHYGYTAGEFLEMRVTDLDAEPSENRPVYPRPLSSTPRRVVSRAYDTAFDAIASYRQQFADTRRDARHRRKDGSMIDVEVRPQPLLFDGHDAVLMVAQDITERKAREQRLTLQALHDSLTGLPNRALLLDRLDQALSVAQRVHGEVAFLLFDLDRFKEVNDTFGHHAGDLLLRQVAARVQDAVRRSDTVARLGGDEFAVVLPETGAEAAQVVAEKIRAAIGRAVTLDGQELMVDASIGIARFPEDGHEGAVLIRRADAAMYAAKRARSGIVACSAVG